MEFSKWWINEFKTIKLPSQGTIFDYYIDPETKKFLPWTDKVPNFELDPDIPLQVTSARAVVGSRAQCPLLPELTDTGDLGPAGQLELALLCATHTPPPTTTPTRPL